MLAGASGLLIGGYDGLGGFVAGVVPPVGLHEHCIDLFEIDGFGAVTHGLDERSDAEIFDGAEGAFGDAQDEGGAGTAVQSRSQ